MRKRVALSALGVAGAIGAAATGYILSNKENKKTNTTFEDAGIPDQAPNRDLAQLENSKMVSEGSQFGVQYYNEAKEED